MSVMIQVFSPTNGCQRPKSGRKTFGLTVLMWISTRTSMSAIFSGFLPCKYKGHDAGFEYYFEPAGPVVESGERLQGAIAGRDSVVSFVTHSDLREAITSVIASGVLCAISDGVLFDDQFTVASAATAWAGDGERSILEELNK